MSTHTPNRCAICSWIKGDEQQSEARYVATFKASLLFVYPDQTYRGRLVLLLARHVESLEQLRSEESHAFYEDLLLATRVLCAEYPGIHVNVALLGNREPHLHWHLVPRRSGDLNSGEAPWPHPTTLLAEADYSRIATSMREAVAKVSTQARSD